jgi:hypothetical protein
VNWHAACAGGWRQRPGGGYGRPSHLVFEVASKSPNTAAQLLSLKTMTRDLDLDDADLPPSFFLAVTSPGAGALRLNSNSAIDQADLACQGGLNAVP